MRMPLAIEKPDLALTRMWLASETLMRARQLSRHARARTMLRVGKSPVAPAKPALAGKK
jgi:hypothetical protein